MIRYKLFIKQYNGSGYDDTELHPNFSNFIYAQDRVDVQNRLDLGGSLVFGGGERGDEYEILLALRDRGKIPFWVQQFNGVDYTTIGYGYLITDGEFDDDSRMVTMNVETFTQYEIYDKSIDTEVSTEPQDYEDVLTVRRWDNKFKTKYLFYPIERDEIQTVQTNAGGLNTDGTSWANNSESGINTLFDEAKVNSIVGNNWYGVRWNGSISPDREPLLAFTFKRAHTVKQVKLYSDGRWDLPQGLVSLYDSGGFLLKSDALAPVTTTGSVHEQTITYTTEIEGVTLITVAYAELGLTQSYYPLEFEFYTDHDELNKSDNTVTGELVLQGARSLRMSIIDLLRANQAPNISAYNPVIEDFLLNFSGTELENALIIPSGSLRGDDDDYENMSLSKMNQFLNNILHRYVRINGSSTLFNAIDGIWFDNDKSGSLIPIKEIDYKENIGLDLTAYQYGADGQLINWSKNLSTINIENLDKPRFIRYRTESKNEFFKTIDVNFDKSISTNDMLEIALDPWATDIEGLLSLPDDFSGKFMLAKCDIITETSHYTQLNNVAISNSGYTVASGFDLLDGAPWANTALTSFTLTNNSVNFQSCETNTFSLSAGDTVRVSTGSDLLVFINLGSAAWQQLTNSEGIAEVTVKDAVTAKIGFIGSTGDYDVVLTVETIIYEVVETDGIANKDFSISKLLDTYIAEMPYNKASFNGFENIDVNQKPDRKIKDILFPLIPLSNSIDLDQGIITDQGVIQPTRISVQWDGSWPKLEGNFYKDDSFLRITEEGEQRITEEGEDRITE